MMRKADIQRSYHTSSRGRPMINVKWYPYLPDIVRKFKGVTRYSRRLGGRYHVHEFGDDPKFWAWVDELMDTTSACEYPTGEFCWAEEIAREVGWDSAKESAEYIFGDRASVYSEGRSGGWLVVDGIGDPDDWNLMDMNQWSKFDRDIRAIVEDLDNRFVWHLYVNVWEPLVVEPERREAERAAEIDAEMLDAIVQSTKEAA